MTDWTDMPTTAELNAELDPEVDARATRQLCVGCGYHDGQHSEDCDLPSWTEAEKRAAAGDA